jgi:protoporphyrinogen oxidase
MVSAPAVPATVKEASTQIDYRAMLLVYLQVDVDHFTEFDAHYFPGATISITRLSEPKNYSVSAEPRGRTILCAELPCSPGDKFWELSDADLGRLVADDLAAAGIPLPKAPSAVRVQRLRQAYPIYKTGYEKPLGVLDDWVESLPRFLSYGRQGLFAHDNTHHALFMAYSAVNCLRDGEFDYQRWEQYREVFATHVVED